MCYLPLRGITFVSAVKPSSLQSNLKMNQNWSQALLGVLFLVHPYSQSSDFPRVITQDSQPEKILICNLYLSCPTLQPPSLELAKTSGGKQAQMLSLSVGPDPPLDSTRSFFTTLFVLKCLKADIFIFSSAFLIVFSKMISPNYLVHHYQLDIQVCSICLFFNVNNNLYYSLIMPVLLLLLSYYENYIFPLLKNF